jgi:hypothetical protein
MEGGLYRSRGGRGQGEKRVEGRDAIARVYQFMWKKKSFWLEALVVFNVLKFNRNYVDRHTICQTVRMDRLYSPDSKPKVHKKQMPS